MKMRGLTAKRPNCVQVEIGSPIERELRNFLPKSNEEVQKSIKQVSPGRANSIRQGAFSSEKWMLFTQFSLEEGSL